MSSRPSELYEAPRIIPLVDKRPRDAGWQTKGKTWVEASKAPMVQRWGCVMGAGLLAVDIDPGAASLALPPTLEARTPRGGRHLVYRGTGRTLVGALPHVDIRGEGGLIAVAPTAGYEWVNDVPIADAPAWVLELCAPSTIEPHGERPAGLVPDVARATDIARRALPPGSGETGDTMWRVAQDIVVGCNLEPEAGAALMREHYIPRCDPDVLREEHSGPDGGYERACQQVAVKSGKEWGYLIPSSVPTASVFESVDAFLARTIAPPRDIVWKLQSAQLAFLYGGANASKTWLALELTRQALARGMRVLYAVEEGHPAYLQTRFRDMIPPGSPLGVSVRKGLMLPGSGEALQAAVKAHRADLLIVDPLSDTLGDIDERDNAAMHKVRAALKDIVAHTDVCLLIVHHSSKYGSRQGRDDQGMAMENMRGASVLMGAADLMIEVRREPKEEGVSTVDVTKNRNGGLESGGRLELCFTGERPRVTFLPGERGRAKTEAVREDRAEARARAREAGLDVDVGTILQTLRAGDRSVARLVDVTGLTEYAVKRALRVLREEGP